MKPLGNYSLWGSDAQQYRNHSKMNIFCSEAQKSRKHVNMQSFVIKPKRDHWNNIFVWGPKHERRRTETIRTLSFLRPGTQEAQETIWTSDLVGSEAHKKN